MKKNYQLTAVFKGNVQGVFFRRQVKKFADKYNIFGYVKNLQDGSVEMVAVSDKDTLKLLMNDIQTNPGLGVISNIEKKYSNNYPNFNDFKILY